MKLVDIKQYWILETDDGQKYKRDETGYWEYEWMGVWIKLLHNNDIVEKIFLEVHSR